MSRVPSQPDSVTLIEKVASKCARLNIPLYATLELTYRCNLRCAHCYVDITENDELSFDEWKTAIDQLKAAGTAYLVFTGGEILVRPDFLDIAAYARQIGFLISLLSNFTLITPSIARTIAGLKPQTVRTSLYGATASTHESVTRIPGSFEKTLNGIRYLVDAGVKPTTQILAMNLNIAEVSQTRALAESLGTGTRLGMSLTPSKSGSTLPFRYEANTEEIMKCEWFADLMREAENTALHICKAGKAACSISPHGDVFPCIMFPLKLGNLRQSSFESIWSVETRSELRYLRSMSCSDLDPCDTCNLKNWCLRCAGTAYRESGRINGPSTSACRQAQMRWRQNKNKEK